MKTALIYGASGGIAAALAQHLSPGGWQLALASRTPENLIDLPHSIKITADGTTAHGANTAVEETLKTFGQIDATVNAIGSILLKPAHLTSDEQWDEVIKVNLTSCFNVLRASAKAMTKTGGAIAFVSSVAAGRGFANHEAIAAAKAGVEGLTRSAAATYASKQIRINAVAPGLTNTPAAEFITQNEGALHASVDMHPLKRIGQPKDIVNGLAWLIDPEQSWVTGQIIGIDGGLGALHQR